MTLKINDNELRGREMGSTYNQNNVKNLYELAPYPGLGDKLKSNHIEEMIEFLPAEKNKSLTYLEAGCGTGHLLIGVAKENPNWNCLGIDLSSASIQMASDIANKHNCEVKLHQNSYLDELTIPKKSIDIISAQGTIHHCDDPEKALRNLSSYLKDDGIISMHLYGARLDSKKFDLKEAISIFQPDMNNYIDRYRIYDALIKYNKKRNFLKSVLDTSILDILRILRHFFKNKFRKSKNVTWSPPWTDYYNKLNSPWKDHFCHPCERAYEIPDVKKLLEYSGLKIVSMRTQAKIEEELIPSDLRLEFSKLDNWEKFRLMELLGPNRSYSMLLKKI